MSTLRGECPPASIRSCPTSTSAGTRTADTARLFTEIQQQGYKGSKRTLRRHVQDHRATGKPAPKKIKELTARRATRLITSHPENLDGPETLLLKKLRARCPELHAVPNAWPPSPR
ncbi:hypothetical protein [Nocardiopsis rhodophaea]|uniref:hypothetical protein n=1 Tax=Nocardiopsis rhodophaea TaxID=280238 RepID=UPI0031CEF4B6